MLAGNEFRAAGPASENARSPNLVRNREVTQRLDVTEIAGRNAMNCWRL